MTQIEIRNLVNYDENIGKMVWKEILPYHRAKVGDFVGTLHHSGYYYVTINKVYYGIHRLIWLYVHGKFPTNVIDHINGIRSDNRLCNLREATQQQNCMNRRKNVNNTSGYTGVVLDKRTGNWNAQTKIMKKNIHIGTFKTPEDANDAYIRYVKELFGEFYNNK